MTPLQFFKMSGAGNDFIVIDNRSGQLPAEGRADRFAVWCRRRTGVGADGVLLVEPPRRPDHHFRMRYYNADGGEAETCGNGARCIARFAHLIGAAPDHMNFETEAGPYSAEVLPGGEVSLAMPDPADLRRNVNLDLPDLDGPLDYINTGVPHAVAFVEEIATVDLPRLGSEIRYHRAFAPAGANVNFAQVNADGTISMRTYERGVEAETLACGTGAIAVALIAYLRGFAVSPASIRTSGGPILTIHFEPREGGFGAIRLQGEARVVYRGTLQEEPAADILASPVATAAATEPS